MVHAIAQPLAPCTLSRKRLQVPVRRRERLVGCGPVDVGQLFTPLPIIRFEPVEDTHGLLHFALIASETEEGLCVGQAGEPIQDPIGSVVDPLPDVKEPLSFGPDVSGSSDHQRLAGSSSAGGGGSSGNVSASGSFSAR
jgi:hypothetical protein